MAFAAFSKAAMFAPANLVSTKTVVSAVVFAVLKCLS